LSKTKNNSKRAILLLLLLLLLCGAVVLGILAWKNLEPIVEAEQKWQEIVLAGVLQSGRQCGLRKGNAHAAAE
jgi:hypothetical protein